MIADLKPYPAMKDSSVPLLDESSCAEVATRVQPKLSTPLRVLPGTHNRFITGRSRYSDSLKFHHIRNVLSQPLGKTTEGEK